jgi:O-acetyl-ADP-ribose deacetylase (regulator of RNase III)
MLEFISNLDIFKSNADCIVNPVNTEGIMGKGLALAFKKNYPYMFIDYKKNCDNNTLLIGKLHFFYENNKVICNFPTKKRWVDNSKLEYIELGLIELRKQILEQEIKSITIPKLGCGLGNLEWKDVCNLIITNLDNLDCKIIIIGEKG